MSDFFDGKSAEFARDKLMANSAAVNALADTADGKAAVDFAKENENAIKQAVESGSTAELSRLLSSFLSTDAGMRLSEKLGELVR